MPKINKFLLRYSYTALLLISVFLLSIYIVICTPIVYNKKLGILATSLISQVIWSIFSKMLPLVFNLKLQLNDLDKLKDNENVIVISNHIGAIDFMSINEVSKRKNMLRHSRYMIKDSVKYVPILGYIQFAGFPLLQRNYEKDVLTIKNWLSFFKKSKTPFWFVIYPEGTRFTQQKKIKSDEYCEQKGIKKLKNVLLPRSKGFSLALNELRGHIKHVVDLTIMYDNKERNEVPSLYEFIFGNPKGDFYIKSQVFEVEEIVDPDNFLKNLFYEKDKTISEWKKKQNREL